MVTTMQKRTSERREKGDVISHIYIFCMYGAYCIATKIFLKPFKGDPCYIRLFNFILRAITLTVFANCFYTVYLYFTSFKHHQTTLTEK